MSGEYHLLDDLSDRELDVITLLAQGKTNAEIANDLFLATSTVKWYVRQINSKLNTSNRHEIVEAAEQFDLLISSDQEQNAYKNVQSTLPRQTTPFIGRDAELSTLHTLLEREEVRLVTILAPGGMGKTRIALEASEQQTNNFPDGVYFVPLQPLSDVEQIIPQIATTIHYQFSSNERDPKQQLLDFLSEKSILLCIDNWEHLLEGVSIVNDILTAAPAVKVLATSREKLNLIGETVYPLQGMTFLTWETPDDVLAYDAVQLLVQTAQRMKPGWTITEENLDDVARICRFTQGMPLAILLAMSWIDMLSVRQIADEIETSLDFLETDLRDMPERQQSIRAIFDHTWNRLRADEKAIFMKLSVFRGGFTYAAAKTITGATTRTLHRLIERALMINLATERFDVHELLRQYAHEHLTNSENLTAVKDTHMNYYLTYVQERELQLRDHRQIDAMRDLRANFDNIRVAWMHALHRAHYARLEAVVFTLYRFMEIIKYDEQAIMLFTVALDAMPASDDPSSLGTKLTVCLAAFRISQGRYTEAQTMLEESSQAVDNYCNPIEQSYYRFNQSRLSYGIRDYDQGVAYAKALIDLATHENDTWGIGWGHWLTYLNIRISDQNRAQQSVERSLQLFSDLGVRVGMAWAYLGMGYMALLNYETDEHIAYNEQCLQLFKEFDPLGAYNALNNLCLMTQMLGDWQWAEDYHQQLQAISEYMSNPRRVSGIHHRLTHFQFLRGDYDIYNQVSLPTHDWEGRWDPGTYYQVRILQGLTQKDYPQAQRFAIKLLEFMNQHGRDWSNFAIAHFYVGLVACFADQYDDAITHLNHATAAYLKVSGTVFLLQLLAAYAMLLVDTNPDRAIECFGIIDHHSVRLPWLQEHPKLARLRQDLQAQVGENEYKALWQAGGTYDLEMALQDLSADVREIFGQ